MSSCKDLLLSALKVDRYERPSAESVARKLQQLTKFPLSRPSALFDLGVYSNNSVYDESSRHLLSAGETSDQVFKEDIARHKHTSGPQVVRASVSRSASEDCQGNSIHRTDVTEPADGWDWVEKLQTIGYNIQEINDILLEKDRDAPWIYFEPDRIFPDVIPELDLHISECCHSLREDRQQGLASNSMATSKLRIYPETFNDDDIVKCVEELCGLCGISPTSRIATDWLGSASFDEDHNAVAVTYSLPTDQYRVPSVNTIIGRISQALHGFCCAAGLLQMRNLCCDSFTVVRHGGWSSEVDGVAAGKVVSLGFQLVHNLAESLKTSMGTTTPSPREILSASSAILTVISPEFEVTHDENDTSVCLHLGAVAVQLLCLGFISYVQAHIGPIQPFFLDTPIRRAALLGINGDNKYPNLVAKLVNITCLGDDSRAYLDVF